MNGKSLAITILSLLSVLFLFVVSDMIGSNIGTTIALGLFAIIIILLTVTSKRSSRFFYALLLIASIIMLMLTAMKIAYDSIFALYYVLAVLFALFIAILDIINYIEKVEHALDKMKKALDMKNKDLDKRDKKTKQLEKDLESLQNKKDQTKKIANQNKAMKTLETENKKLKEQVKKAEKETEKQVELKQKYSKTLTNTRKRKKEEEELLIVSSDGKSVHKPKCIAVRNVPKENRKLIKNWETAEKEGYSGCKLCSPHVKPTVIEKDNRKYRFVASKDSDKLHTADCKLIDNINKEEQVYFSTYKAALKKGYTACRVCNPQ
jgi:uncharacterized membrane protein YgaE (UPF0421/DUF939 family)